LPVSFPVVPTLRSPPKLKDKLRQGLDAYVAALNAVKDAGFEPVASIAPSAYGGRFVITDIAVNKKF
jgi:hypothetical protein